uniref:Uncharacterized protein n=1 Tax=Grammatophora oceanica TaxID=210454 RepID=A0A7S1UYL5_9STRA|mmetsp:Transcript_29799/g.43948  ORF Transcript_29799/g.43948 Transcript_29799/m.43948 type:complete len:342 (+) Transcript_29799:126-1151(+)|eukprot:CAMPEP_0194033968 /NCGR_PEP_ID=MMETSP0009_2-20130614/6422_1 /TAXON_ID=210454 /ORGANISM="Grammatophora oceanica, Strain CCMP 410" /LENGTH=341 /DNA_ID=CAMNT_0038674701 /DNA_START=51 /DNA_END=1076 /DNA_ORIENTATION=-
MVVLKMANPSRRARTTLYRGTASAAVRHPPVVLEWTDACIRFGLAEESHPKHCLAWKSPPSGKLLNESEWYAILMPLLHEVYDRLMISIPTRRVILVSSHCMIRTWEAALLQGLWNMGVPAVSKMSNLAVPSIALGLSKCLVVSLGKYFVECVAVIDEHVLDDTYQAVPCSALWSETIQPKWTDDMERKLLSPKDPNSLVAAILKCVEKCPLLGREDAVNNLVFIGDVWRPDLPYRTVSSLRTLLKDGIPAEEGGDSLGEEEGMEEGGDPAEPLAETIMLPARFDELKSLAASIAAKSVEPFGPMHVSWTGASLWATVWHRTDDEDGLSRMKWIFPPSEAV